MRRFVLVCLCLLSLGSLCAQKSYKEVVGRAMDCVLKDSLAEAETLFREALKDGHAVRCRVPCDAGYRFP